MIIVLLKKNVIANYKEGISYKTLENFYNKNYIFIIRDKLEPIIKTGTEKQPKILFNNDGTTKIIFKKIDKYGQNIYTPNEAEKFAYVRYKRNQILAETDWTQISDTPLPAKIKADWGTYRQALRDLPTKININKQVWPEKPE